MKNKLNEIIYGKELANNLEEINNKELKEKFIEYFGQEKWDQEEELAMLMKIGLKICEDLYLEPIPIVCDDIEEESRLDIEDMYIIISSKIIHNKLEAIKSLIYQLRIYYQLVCVSIDDETEPKRIEWAQDFKSLHLEETISKGNYLSIYIDAYAYMKHFLKIILGINYMHMDVIYDEILNKYIENNFNE